MTSLSDIEEIGDFGHNGGMVGAAEDVFLRVFVDIGEAVVVAAFDEEMTGSRVEFQSCSSSYAIVELLLYGHAILGEHAIRAVGVTFSVKREIALAGGFSDAVSYLRACQEKAHGASFFASPGQTGEEGKLDIVEMALIGVGQRLAVGIEHVFLPSEFGIVELHLQGAEGLEVFLTGEAGHDAHGGSHMEGLLDGGVEAYAVHAYAACHANGNVTAYLAHLGLHGGSGEEKGGEKEKGGSTGVDGHDVGGCRYGSRLIFSAEDLNWSPSSSTFHLHLSFGTFFDLSSVV